ncbi:methyltransferase domain-containing protein [Paenibacillus sp. FSL R7-0204]|uniref:methyltransferase domain-containing protein n=1 Tax=Paenibacillus sp. FSL R7-0204 TaxID=2921675 RepID=UPI0030F4C108
MYNPDATQANHQPDLQESQLSKTHLNLLNYANFLYNQKNHENAAVFYEKFLQEAKTLNEETFEAYGRLTDCYVTSGDVDKALLSAFQSFTYGIPHPVICYKIGNAFVQKSQLNMAIFWFDMATKETIANEHVNYDASFAQWLPHLQLCVCYEMLGDHTKAYHHHSLAQKYNPDHPSIVLNQKYFETLFRTNGEPYPRTQEKAEGSKANDTASMENKVEIAEQNDVVFTGERLVINDTVKKNHGDVLEEHLNRYRLAQHFVKDKRVLDAACGAGYGSKMLQAAGASHVLGVDIDEASLVNARKTYGHDQIEYAYGNVNKLELEDKSFDIIVSFETIEHINDGSVWIKESSRLLKDDGIFIVSTPNRSQTNPVKYFVEQPQNFHHKYEYTITEFVGELLKEYDILELYGQTFVSDYSSIQTQAIRNAIGLKSTTTPYNNPVINGHELIELGKVKDMNPLYVVAVCKKKLVLR